MLRRTFIQSGVAAAALAPFGRVLAAGVTGATRNVEARTLTGGEVILPQSSVNDFIAGLRGTALLPGDAAYDGVRRVWNGMIDRRPALIARCAGAADVRRAIDFARDHNLIVAVRGGGHSISGQSVCDGGLMIDLAPMRWVRVDPVARRAILGPGSLLGDLDRECLAFGLVTTAGTVSHTGAAGLTLGGGQGRLQRIHGLTCDNLVAAQLVAANGELIRTTERENAELLWGLRGGGGNFGVVTSFEYRLHPFSGTVLGGELLYPLDQARAVFDFYAEFTQTTPDELHLTMAMLSPTGGKPLVAVQACYAGDLARGERVIEPLRGFGKPIADRIKPMPYLELQTNNDVANAAGKNYYAKSGFVTKLEPGLLDELIGSFPTAPKRATVAVIQQFGGAMGRVREDATAYAGRKAAYEILTLGGWGDALENERNVADVRGYWKRLEPYTSGFYTNTSSLDEQDRVRANYGRHYDRLVRLKDRYDPGNLFRLNANVKPTAA
jgi:hypothetical protein